MPSTRLTRRQLLAGAASLVGVGAAARLAGASPFGATAGTGETHAPGETHVPATHGGVDGAAGAATAHGVSAHGRTTVDPALNGFDPSVIVRDFDLGSERRLPDGRILREWQLYAYDKEIEVAPGVKFAAWTYNGRVPGPTLRAREGELLRIHFINGSRHPHTVHFHGLHTAVMDGVPGVGEGAGGGLIAPGEEFTYEFEAEPFGFHHYHCHVPPLAQHVHKGLYGGFIIDPRTPRPEADELIMVMNGFDTNFDGANEVYAVNTVAFHYLHAPIRVKRDQLVRIYLLNILEFDQINSFHIHANFFHYYPTGTSLEPAEFTDIVLQAQGQRGILELRFPYTGNYMFHAHKNEFAELGWMGFFEVVD